MKKTMINYVKNEKYDELYTPVEAIEPLLKYLPKDKIYWECTDFGSSEITNYLKTNGYNVVSTHIGSGFDFLKDKPNFDFDIIVTNPPYSIKNDFLKRAYELGKPFCFLLPLTTLEGVFRGKLFNKYGVELLVLNKRINFLKNKNNVWYNTSWFCWNVLPEKIIFEEVKK